LRSRKIRGSVEERFWDRIKEMALLGQSGAYLLNVAEEVGEGNKHDDIAKAILEAGADEIRWEWRDLLLSLSTAISAWFSLRSYYGPARFRAILGVLLEKARWMRPWLEEELEDAC